MGSGFRRTFYAPHYPDQYFFTSILGIPEKWWVIFPLITILGNYNYFVSTFQWPWKESLTCAKNQTLTIGSYNVEGFYWIARNEEQKPIITLVKEYHIDILCIQEHCEESNIDSITLKKESAFRFGRYSSTDIPIGLISVSVFTAVTPFSGPGK